MNLPDLHKPFPPSEIEWRVGSTNGEKTQGLALAYLTARHVMERLDEVCGAENWQDRYEFHGTRTVCYLSIRVGDEWVTKADGAGDSDVEAEKGAISDALKRAAVKWGIGRYLYDLGNTWVEIEAAGRSFRIKKTEYAKLETSLARQFGMPAPPALQAPVSVEAYLVQLDAASDLATLQAVFRDAYTEHPGANSRTTIKSRYDARKTALTPIPKTLGDHLDNLERDAAANPN